MFRLLGTTIKYSWPVWLVGWLAALAFLWLTAPPWSEVSRDQEFAFLPEDAPSRQGETIYKQAFPGAQEASNVVLVLTRQQEELQPQDRTFVKDVVRPALWQIAEEEGGLGEPDEATPDSAKAKDPEKMPLMAAVRTLLDPGTGNLLLSADRKATLVVVELTTELLESQNWHLLTKIEKLVADWQEKGRVPPGLAVSLTGSATVGRDMTRGQMESAQATQFWTVVLVIAMLLLIYRAPLLAFIPLISVYMATQISLKLLAHLSRLGLVTLFGGVEIYIVIILYGCGVDYCLFLIARYREEREHGADWGTALANAIGHVGPALSASALTVICGLGMMIFAKFGKFHDAGLTVALAIVVGLCVVLTFTTSLLRLVGPVAFWPHVPRPAPVNHDASDKEHLARSVRTTLLGWISWQALAHAITRRPGVIWLCTVLLMSPFAVYGFMEADHVDYDFLRRLPPGAPSVVGIKALEEHFPAGAAAPIKLLVCDPNHDFSDKDTKGQIAIERLTERLTKQRLELQLADVRSLMEPLGFTWAAQQVIGIPPAELEKGWQRALRFYVGSEVTKAGHVTRLDLTTKLNPLSRQGIALLNQLETAIRNDLPTELSQAKIYFIGNTANMRDLRRVTSSDQILIQVLATVGVLTILVILLWQVTVPVYLILSVLFSYFATLGVTLLLFWGLDPEGFVGLDWKVPIFLFVILIAIGEDYNIFLMTRMHEEQKRHGPVPGIEVALVKTGRIITSCGIIMAGTFSSLMTGTVEDLKHLGFALTFGVIVDTFVVRPILVPSFLVLLERGRLLRHKLSEIRKQEEEKVTP